MTVAPAGLDAIAAQVDERISNLLAAELRRWSAVDGALTEPLEALHSLALRGGKRLRPAFCVAGFVSAGGDAGDAACIDVAAGLELLHVFALIHDDVMDGSAIRRRQPAVHRQFEALHTERGRRGEARRFGEGVAILVGDLAFVYADMLFAGVSDDARRLFDELRLEVNMGQYLDLAGTARADVSAEEAGRIIRYKSAKYTVERPLHLGAALAGAADRLENPFTAYGLPIGDAFQLRDDLLGCFGDSELTGKPVGEDIREGKPTVLIALARGRAAGAHAAALENYGDPDIDTAGIAAVCDALVATDAVADVERRIKTLVDDGRRALEGVDITPDGRHRLDALAEFATRRVY